MKYKTFTEWLQEIHSRQYQGTDDNMPEDFEAWLSELSIDELVDFGEQIVMKIAELNSN